MAWTDGNHIAKITGHVLGLTGTGKPQIAVEFTKEYTDAEGNSGEESLTWYGYFTENARQITIDALKAMGWDAAADGHDIEKLHNTDRLLGNQCRVVVKHEADLEGEMRPRIAFVNKSGAAVKEELPKDQISALAANIKGDLIKAFGTESKAPPPQTSIEEEDIPF